MAEEGIKSEVELGGNTEQATVESALESARRAVFAAEDDQVESAVSEDAEPNPEVDGDEEEAALASEVSDSSSDEADGDSGDEPVVSEAERKGWDGNPDHLPEDLKPTYKEMQGYLTRETQKLANERRADEAKRAELEALLAEARAGRVNRAPGQAPEGNQQDSPPPLPTAEDDAETFYQKLDARTQWQAKQVLRESIERGEVITREQFAPVASSMSSVQLERKVRSMDGYTDEVGAKMAELAEDAMARGDSAYAMQILDERGVERVFNDARTQMRLEAAERALAEANESRAAKVAEDTRNKAAAASRAVSRPGSVRTPSKPSGPPKNATPEERLEYARKAVFASEG